mmetsp:Transcript_19538/g.52661  ORF Transcript_19538/g.52661 Transcript_19538/m.52661 type:complete len:265 (-) Transcript_19538:454-1248(-)
MGDDWDDDDFEVPTLAGKAAQEAPESWSDEEAHEVKKDAEPALTDAAPAPKPAAPPKPKDMRKQKILEREAREREEAEKAKAAAARAKSSVVLGDDRGLLDGARGAEGSQPTAASEKARLRQLEEEADFENTQGLFGSLAVKKNDAPGAETIDAFVARTAADGEALAEKVANKLLTLENTPFFVEMLKSINKKVTVNLSSDDVKDLATTVQVVANDKLKAEREKQKGKKKLTKAASKATVKETHNSAYDNTDDYGGYDDDYDFM